MSVTICAPKKNTLHSTGRPRTKHTWRGFAARSWFEATSIDQIERLSVIAHVVVEDEKANSRCTRTAHAAT